MSTYSLSHLADQVLLHELAALSGRDRVITANLLAHLAEVDTRKLYVPAGHPSMFSYCVHELRMSEDAAYERIQAARAARQFPEIFRAVAEGRLHLAAVCLLAPHLTSGNVDGLLLTAAHRTKAQVEQLLAQRFPRPELRTMVRALPATSRASNPQLAPGQVGADILENAGSATAQLTPRPVEAETPRPRVTPLGPERFAIQFTMGQEMHDDLRYAQKLLSHQIPSGNVPQVLHCALKTLIGQLEKRK